jgi:hypothetical protein
MSFDRACEICHRTQWFDKSANIWKPLEVCRSDAHGGKFTCKFCHFERRPRKSVEECVRRFEGSGWVFVNREKFIKEAAEIERSEIDDAERYRAAYAASQVCIRPSTNPDCAICVARDDGFACIACEWQDYRRRRAEAS